MKALKFKRINLMKGFDTALYVYESRGDFLQGVKLVRVCKSRLGDWEIKVGDDTSPRLKNHYGNFSTMKEACFRANTDFNPKYNFMSDMDYAWDFYKI